MLLPEKYACLRLPNFSSPVLSITLSPEESDPNGVPRLLSVDFEEPAVQVLSLFPWRTKTQSEKETFSCFFFSRIIAKNEATPFRGFEGTAFIFISAIATKIKSLRSRLIYSMGVRCKKFGGRFRPGMDSNIAKNGWKVEMWQKVGEKNRNAANKLFF
jgi:hypothetical protein